MRIHLPLRYREKRVLFLYDSVSHKRREKQNGEAESESEK